jgi:hypothetical protein
VSRERHTSKPQRAPKTMNKPEGYKVYLEKETPERILAYDLDILGINIMQIKHG